MNGCLGEIFGVEVGFFGKLISNVARINMDGVVGVANDKHLQPWGKVRGCVRGADCKERSES